MGRPGLRRVLRLRQPSGERRPRDPRRAACRAAVTSSRRPGSPGRSARDRLGGDRLPGCIRPPWRGPRRAGAGPDHSANRPVPERASRASSPGGPSTKTAGSAMPRPRSTGRTARRWRSRVSCGSPRARKDAADGRQSAIVRGVSATSKPAVLVVGGKQVDGHGLADRRPRRQLERQAELPDTPFADDGHRIGIGEREHVDHVPSHQVAFLEARQLEHAASRGEHPGVAVADDEPGRRRRIVVLEQLEDEAEAAAAALQRLRAREPLEAVDVDRAVLAVRADVDGHRPIVGIPVRGDRRTRQTRRMTPPPRSLAARPGTRCARRDHPVCTLARGVARASAAGLRELVGVVDDGSRGLLGLDLGALRRRRLGPVRACARRAGDAGGEMVPRRAPQLRRAHPAAERLRPRRDPTCVGDAVAGRGDPW